MRGFVRMALVCGLVMGVVVYAQGDARAYRLRVPTAEEYLAGLPDFTSYENEFSDLQQYQQDRVVSAAEAEFLFRYEADADFALVWDAYDQLKIGIYRSPSIGGASPVIDYNAWIVRLIQAWLNEHLIDLASYTTLQFEDFTVNVERRDFNSDGEDELLLDVVKGIDDVEYRNYIVVISTENGYRVLPVPLPWTADGFWENSHQYPPNEVAFEDVNSDGLPEWILLKSTSSSSPGYYYTHTVTYILGWRENQIVQIGLIEVHTTMENLDDDPEQEFYNFEAHSDNWGCGSRSITVYDWNGFEYIQLPPSIEAFDCTARDAELAMWSGDFETAVVLYERFLDNYLAEFEEYIESQRSCDCDNGNRTIPIYFYLRARRIIAYALLGNEERVNVLLDELRQSEQISVFEQAILDVNTANGETICYAAHAYYSTIHSLRPLEGTMEDGFFPGEVIPDVRGGQDIYLGRVINPLLAGCDIRIFSGEPIPTMTPTATPFPTLPPPTPDPRTEEQIWIDRVDFYTPFRAGDFQTVIHMTSQVIFEGEFQEAEALYYQALSLEALGRPDEALAEYVAIYEAAPESVWGMLAALHLEPINP